LYLKKPVKTKKRAKKKKMNIYKKREKFEKFVLNCLIGIINKNLKIKKNYFAECDGTGALSLFVQINPRRERHSRSHPAK